jgi:serine/threonine-protein kinase
LPAGVSDSGRTLPLGDDPKTIISNRPPLASPGQGEMEERLDAGKFSPGDMLGPYELIEYIGGGGMGRVYRALDTQLNRIVALKVLPPEHAADVETLLRFRNEARSAARLDHDSVVRVYYVGEDRTFPYLVFEFIEGQTIRALVERGGPLRLADALSYTLQVADVLTHAAERGVVHRDIKPSNVMITPQGRAKVIDLGLARLGDVNDSESDLTASGVTLGTFDYISPEQARDPRTVDVRSDIYSLGCAFFYMLSGRPPSRRARCCKSSCSTKATNRRTFNSFGPNCPTKSRTSCARCWRRIPAIATRRRWS